MRGTLVLIAPVLFLAFFAGHNAYCIGADVPDKEVFEVRVDYRYGFGAYCEPSIVMLSDSFRKALRIKNVERKASSISRMVIGLEPSAARVLVKKGYFPSQMLTWEEFKEEVTRSRVVIGELGSKKILAKNGRYNMSRLATFPGSGARAIASVGKGRGKKKSKKVWNGFFAETSKPKRIRILSKLIRGLSSTEARLIIEAGILDDMPIDWTEFSSRILKLSSRVKRNLAFNVLADYGLENVKRLGYWKKDRCERKLLKLPYWERIRAEGDASLSYRCFNYSRDVSDSVRLGNSSKLQEICSRMQCPASLECLKTIAGYSSEFISMQVVESCIGICTDTQLGCIRSMMGELGMGSVSGTVDFCLHWE